MNTIEYQIPNISCGHCVHTIKMELGDLQGVDGVEVDQETKRVVVRYVAPATNSQIEELLREINYPPVPTAASGV